jgi:hypothetical protein
MLIAFYYPFGMAKSVAFSCHDTMLAITFQNIGPLEELSFSHNRSVSLNANIRKEPLIIASVKQPV